MNQRVQQHADLLRERFNIEERIGEGGFGTVYRAEDIERQAEVAVKVLHRSDAEHLYRFKREFRALADIAHPNLVTLYELGSVEELWFFTMELVEGPDLVEDLTGGAFEFDDDSKLDPDRSRTLELEDSGTTAVQPTAVESPVPETQRQEVPDVRTPERGPDPSGRFAPGVDFPELDLDKIRDRLGELVGALEALHTAGKLHRDIKPSNVLVESGRVVVLDFGMVADLLEPDRRSPSSSSAEVFVGTPRYAAPEQAAGRGATEASDYYAVGVMLYEALTGFVPIDGKSTRDVLVRKRSFHPVDVGEIREDLPRSLTELTMDLLRQRPEERPGPDEILERLDAERSPSREPAAIVDDTAGEEVFIGRDRERATCRDAFRDAARKGESALIRIVGESGIGKTALVERVVGELRRDHPDVSVLRGRCYENESVPYKALDELVDEMSRRLRQSEGHPVEAIPRREFRALVQFFPVLGRLRDDEGPEASAASTLDSDLRDAAVRGFRRLLSQFVEGVAPVVLFVDDVQWGDRDSGELLARILGAEGRPTVVLFVAYRDDEAKQSEFLDALEESLGNLRMEVADRSVRLDALGAEEARELAERLVGVDAMREGRAERIARETDGSPYFIDELSRFLRDRSDDSWSVEHLDDVISTRVDRLDEAARRLLEVVSISGRPLEREVARDVAELGDAGPGAVATLRGNRLARVRSTEGRSRLQTYHDRVRETVVDGLSEDRKRQLHGALARRLEAADADAERLSDHRLRAGDCEIAAVFAVEAAQQAADALAYDRAVRMLERALEHGTWSEKERFTLENHRASMLERLARCEEAADAYLRASRHTDGVQALSARIRSAEQKMSAGHPEPALERLYAVVDELELDVPSRGAASFLPRLAVKRLALRGREFDYELRDADVISERTRVGLRALSVIGGILATMDLKGSAYYQMAYLEQSLASGDPTHVAASMTMHALREGSISPRDAEIWRMLDEIDSLVEATDEPNRIRIVAGLVRGVLLYSRGDWQRSNSAFREVLDEYDPLDSGAMWEFQTLRFYSLMPLYWLGDYERYQEILPDLLEQAREQGNRLLEVAGYSWAYLERLKEDRPEEALEGLDKARERWNVEGYQLPDFWQALGRGETVVYRGDGERAWSLVRAHWWPLHRSLLMQVEIIYVLMHHLRGRLALTAAAEASGLRRQWLGWWVRRSASKLVETDGDYTTGLGRMLQGELAALRGDHRRAVERYERARELLEQTGTAFYATASQHRLGTLRGGEEGGRLVERAEAWLERRGVEEPERMAAMGTARQMGTQFHLQSKGE